MKPISIYIHIPFCIRKCKYCDFLSAPAATPVQEAYLRTLKAEIKSKKEQYTDYQVQTVFIGGGTPTAVEPASLCEVLQTLRENFVIEEAAEISMEANPGTITQKALKLYRAAGINRLSIGLQSADNTELQILGRIHTYEDFLVTYHLAAEAGFTNINVDLMSALPGQTLKGYEATLQKVLSLQPAPAHISAYSLMIEEGTPFYETYGAEREEMDRRGERKKIADENTTLHLPSEEEERLMYERTKQVLREAGYERYEISNYSKPGFCCRHNTVYWRRGDYLGFGLGAASLVNNVRFRNTGHLQEYTEALKPWVAEQEKLSETEQMEEFMFLGLRMTDGVSKAEFMENFGISMESIFGDVIKKNVRDGLLREIPDETGEKSSGRTAFRGRREAGSERIALTDKGLSVSNYVMAQFIL